MDKIETEQFKVCLTRSEHPAVKVISILALCGFLTTICTLAIVFGDAGPWITIGLLAISLHPAVRDRISGKYDAGRLEDRLTLLEMKLSETEKHLLDAQHQILLLEEGADFEKKIGVRATSLSATSASRPLALSLVSSEKTD